MIKTRRYRCRIYPNENQRILIEKTFGCSRFIYNYFLAERSRFYDENKKTLPYSKTSSLMTELKRTSDHLWLNEADSMALQESLKDLDRAFQNFFKKRAKYPRFHSKKSGQSYRTRNQENGIRFVGNKLQLPKLGLVRYKGLKDFNGTIVNATIKRSASGKYYVSLCVEEECYVLPNAGNMLGIDVGLKEFYTDSKGKVVNNPHILTQYEKRLAREQRKLSRKTKGSKNRNKQRLKVAMLHEKISNTRMDFLHKESRKLCSENQTIAIEDLNVKGMVRNHKLAKSISDASWSMFFKFLEYKTTEHGCTLIKVPTFYPSSQTCSCCGYKNPLVKNLAIRKWTCPECNEVHDRDRNAAINILAEGLNILSA